MIARGFPLAAFAALDLSHHIAGGVYAKQTRIPAGMVLVQHKHLYDHLSLLASGTVEVEVDGVRTQHTGPACLTIKAGAHHGVKALTEAVWFCIHATALAEADEVDETLVLPADAAQMREIAEALL